MHARQQRVIHDAESLHQLGVTPQLLLEQSLLLRAERKDAVATDKIEVFQNCARIVACFLFRVFATDSRALPMS